MENQKIKTKEDRYNIGKVESFLYLCEENNFRELVKFQSENNLSLKDINLNENNIFMRACAEGNLQLVIWFYETFKPTKKDIKIIKNCDGHNTFNLICVFGHLHLCKWFYYNFHVTKKEIRKDNCKALFLACGNNHFDVVSFLFDVVGLDENDALNVMSQLSAERKEKLKQYITPYGKNIKIVRKKKESETYFY
jgi:hypothetical protein